MFHIPQDVDFVTLTILYSCFRAYTLEYILFLKCISFCSHSFAHRRLSTLAQSHLLECLLT